MHHNAVKSYYQSYINCADRCRMELWTLPETPRSLGNQGAWKILSQQVSSQPSRHKLGWRGLWWAAPGRGKYVSVSLCTRAHTSKSWGSSLQGISETSGSGDDTTWEAEMLKPVSQPRRKAFRFAFRTCFQQLTKSQSVQNLTLWHFLYSVSKRIQGPRVSKPLIYLRRSHASNDCSCKLSGTFQCPHSETLKLKKFLFLLTVFPPGSKMSIKTPNTRHENPLFNCWSRVGQETLKT